MRRRKELSKGSPSRKQRGVGWKGSKFCLHTYRRVVSPQHILKTLQVCSHPPKGSLRCSETFSSQKINLRLIAMLQCGK